MDARRIEGCDLHQALYRDDGVVLGCVLRLEGDPSIYATPWTHDALRRLGHIQLSTRVRSSARSAPRRASCGRSNGPAGRSRQSPAVQPPSIPTLIMFARMPLLSDNACNAREGHSASRHPRKEHGPFGRRLHNLSFRPASRRLRPGSERGSTAFLADRVRDDNALTFGQCGGLRHFIELG